MRKVLHKYTGGSTQSPPGPGEGEGLSGRATNMRQHFSITRKPAKKLLRIIINIKIPSHTPPL